ncbi:MAG: long-chain-fatty-acid--CoA ligase [Alphaproteobacteria bacterium]|nr:long-chain-fatty-acid--CoA ligase [Alphaproteobacteria bacterium]
MLGSMMDRPLLVSSLIEHAARNHGEREIVSRSVEGPIHRYSYAALARRAKQLAHALDRHLGIAPGDRVATLAWNGYRHLELYYGVSGMGAVLHTMNPRLFPDQLAYILNHAADTCLFLDLTFVPLAEALAPSLDTVKAYVIMTDAAHMPATTLPGALCYETLLAGQPDTRPWPPLDERTASSMCYTSGTTGHPKGVVYQNRSTVLHAYAACSVDALAISCRDSILPVVPMFHVNAWGIPYAAAMTGAKLVLPGPKLDGASLHELMEAERVTMSAGVPTVWLGVLGHMRESGERFSTLERVVCGGSAVPRAMIEAFEVDHGVHMLHAWGMTEMSPLGTVCAFKPGMAELPAAERFAIQEKQGRAVCGVELKITDDAGRALAHDGKTFGNLWARGPWVCQAYYKDEGGEAFDDGWFNTGDVATIDAQGYMQVVDRAKDLIKSGGEWISSIEIENLAVGHPAVREACVVAVKHPKWDERPLLLVVPAAGRTIDKPQMLAYLAGRVPNWWLPDEVLVVPELPHTGTGKLIKSQLRAQYRDYILPTA